jgi:predicted acylesterase/phospholipase RssA
MSYRFMKALILSGGSVRGAFQVGAVESGGACSDEA